MHFNSLKLHKKLSGELIGLGKIAVGCAHLYLLLMRGTGALSVSSNFSIAKNKKPAYIKHYIYSIATYFMFFFFFFLILGEGFGSWVHGIFQLAAII